MKVTYTGVVPFTDLQKKKLDVKFGKLGKLIDGRAGEKEAHVILTTQRHLQRAEITVNAHNHSMVGLESSSDPFLAVTTAVDKLEKQVLRLREKKRDTKRTPDGKNWPASAAPAPAKAAPPPKKAAKAAKSAQPGTKQVFKVNSHSSRKPMTAEEAMLEMESGENYFVYRDAETDRVSVLVKRGDGHFDLIES